MSRNEVNGISAGVDIAIPCYQYGRFLRDCVASVFNQGIADVRILIIDNASGDNSLEVAQELATEDLRVEVVAHRRNLGQHASFNEAIDWALSEYFVLLCADDLLAPGALMRAVSIMERHPDVGFAYGRAVYHRPGDAMPALDSQPHDSLWRIVAGEEILGRFCRDGVNHIPGPSTMVVRTTMQKRAGHYRPELPHTDDFEMWMRLACLGSAARTEACQAILRLHPSAQKTLASRDYACERPPAMPWEDEAAFDSFFAHEGGGLPEAPHLQRLAKRSLGDRAYWASVAHLCRGRFGASRDLLRFAFARRPASAVLPPVGYLFRRHDAASRIISVASELVRRPLVGRVSV